MKDNVGRRKNQVRRVEGSCWREEGSCWRELRIGLEERNNQVRRKFRIRLVGRRIRLEGRKTKKGGIRFGGYEG
jgi:hypothetical protein